jgi:hypothetical protein
MEEAIEKINYKGKIIETFYDFNPLSPEDWRNDELFLVYDHRDFTVKVKGFDPEDIFQYFQENPKKVLYEGYFVFPVYAYIHTGVCLSLGRDSYPFTCRWDTSFRGFVLCKKQKGCYTSKKAYDLAEGLIEEWNQYLSGDVYGYNSEVGSCWGFYGKSGYNQMIDEAKSEIDYAEKKAVKNHIVKVKEQIKSKVPFIYRKQFVF